MHNRAGKEGRKRLLGSAQMVTLCAGDNVDRLPCRVSLKIAGLQYDYLNMQAELLQRISPKTLGETPEAFETAHNLN